VAFTCKYKQQQNQNSSPLIHKATLPSPSFLCPNQYFTSQSIITASKQFSHQFPSPQPSPHPNFTTITEASLPQFIITITTMATTFLTCCNQFHNHSHSLLRSLFLLITKSFTHPPSIFTCKHKNSQQLIKQLRNHRARAKFQSQNPCQSPSITAHGTFTLLP
jgi:hypothetical protein